MIVNDVSAIELLFEMKFNKIGFDPIHKVELNIIEQINQTFSDIVILEAAKDLLTIYSGKSFELRLGTMAGFDIESTDGAIVAECFAVTTASSNGKLKKDSEKLMTKASRQKKFIYFYSWNDSDSALQRIYDKYPEIVYRRLSEISLNIILGGYDMLTKEEYEQIMARMQSKEISKAAFQMTDADKKRFEKNTKLPLMISERKMQNDIEKGLKAIHGYSDIEKSCLISVTSLKKVINGSDKVTRKFLYKFAVGLHMSIDEANEFFKLCGGELHDDSLEDCICKCALRDKDNIHDFVEEFENLTNTKIAR